MDLFFRIIGVLFYMIIPVGVLLLCLNIIYRKVKGKGLFTSGTSFVGEYMIQEWETAGNKNAIKEIQYEREEKRNDAEPGEPPDHETGKDSFDSK